MKKVLFLLMMVLSLFLNLACSNSSGGGSSFVDDSGDSGVVDDSGTVDDRGAVDEVVLPGLTVSDIQFDSLTYVLRANTNAADGTELTVTCNNKSEKALVSGGKIALTYPTPFYAGIKGGRSYPVTFTAPGYSQASSNISYWPKAKFNYATAEKITVYTGGAVGFVEPEIILTNYDSSSVVIEKKFMVWDEGICQFIEAPTWTVDAVRNFLGDENNNGKAVAVYYKITPNCDGGSSLAATGSIVYECKTDVLIQSVGIQKLYGVYEAFLYETDNPDYSKEQETAGGDVSYQWQVSPDYNSFTDIEGATSKKLKITNENQAALLGNYIRVKINQTFQGAASPKGDILSEPMRVAHAIKTNGLYYDGIIDSGNSFDISKIKGFVTDELDNTHNASVFEWYQLYDEAYTAFSSKNFRVKYESSVFYDDVVEIYAVVRGVMNPDAIPSLSTDVTSINFGNVKFYTLDGGVEVSLDGGLTYQEPSMDEFPAEVGKVLYIRKKASGTPNEMGYIKESEPYKLTVKAENIGRKTNGGSIIGDLTIPELSLSKTTENGKIYITPVITGIPDGYYYDYKWTFSNRPASDWSGSGVTVEGKKLVIDKSNFTQSIHQVFCLVDVYYTDAKDLKFITLSKQISVTVN